jgi:hypothetical protein
MLNIFRDSKTKVLFFGICMKTIVYSEKKPCKEKVLQKCYKKDRVQLSPKMVRGETPQKANHTNQDPFGF